MSTYLRIYLLLFVFIATGCAIYYSDNLPPKPNSTHYNRFASPLQVQLDSPLMTHTSIPSTDLPEPADLFVHPQTEATHKLFMPSISTGYSFCEKTLEGNVLAQLLVQHPKQNRTTMKCDTLLTSIAQERAESMVTRRYFAHCDPDNVCPNRLARNRGYRLPAHYGNENNIESIAANQLTPVEAFNALLNSPSHRVHLLADHPFYVDQECYGMGYAFRAVVGLDRLRPIINASSWFPTERAYVIITAPCS